METTVDKQIIYFKKPEGWMKYGKHAGDAIHFRGGVYETESPIVLEAAQRDLLAGGVVETIQPKVQPKPAPQPEPEPKPAPRFCNRCKIMVDADDWVEHIALHGRAKR
jgi:hypothetical protein